MILLLSRTCGASTCEDTACFSNNTCQIFTDPSLCKSTCKFPTACKAKQITIDSILFTSHCQLLDSGKIFAISIAVFVVLSIVAADIFLVIYCRRIDKKGDVITNGALDEFEGIRRVKRAKKSHNYTNVRGAIEAEIAGINVVAEKEIARDGAVQNGLIQLRDALLQQAMADRVQQHELGIITGIESKISIFQDQICPFY